MGVTDPVFADFQVHMTVAEVIADAGQLQGILTVNRGDCFCGRQYLDNGVVVCGQTVTTPKDDAPFQEESGFFTIVKSDPLAAFAAL